MKNSENPLPTPSYPGHVRNGVVVLESQVLLPEGQAVRVEPLAGQSGAPIGQEREERLQRMRELFGQWTDEDAQLSDADADLLHAALTGRHGLQFRAPILD